MKIRCVGYTGHKCRRIIVKNCSRHKRCAVCAAKEKILGTKLRYSPEVGSVRSHRSHIFNPNTKDHKYYKGMPFYDEWNPDRGGLTLAGGKWIIENLGKRPKGSQLHIIDHEKGFVPGNLEWTFPRKQQKQQMFKIIAELRHQIKVLKTKLRKVAQ